MADSNIGALPQAASLDDDSLLVAEQQGQAVKVTGAQFKEFGRQAVIGQVQGYVDQAEAAADRAVDAVSAVTDMTVEASTLASGESATVTKTTKNGKVNLSFGLPRGEQGETGQTGATGPRGPQGPTGKGLTILGYYDTLDALEAAVPSPNAGDAYGVGLIAPYNIYVFDGVSNEWKDNGPLSGGGGGVLPENVVTADGGASMTFPIDLGDGPHVITFTDEEEPPLTAEDIQYDDTQDVKQAIDGLKSSVSDGKALVASAITDKGVTTAQDATFAQMAKNIGDISTGADTSDATATSFDILSPKTAYTAVGKVEGTIPTLLGQTIIPGTADKTIANGQYLGGTQVIKGDPNLTSGNIKSGVAIFGVEGALESSFKATLTVTADTGAVVTATHTDGTEVSALSQTGTVVLELPKEGTWKVTAVRGVAQYNTVTIQVSSSYSAELTAEVHVEYFIESTPLYSGRNMLAATTAVDYALFAGGMDGSSGASIVVDAYDSEFTRTSLLYGTGGLDTGRYNLSAATVGGKAIFAGGATSSGVTGASNVVEQYDRWLVKGMNKALGVARSSLAAVSMEGYALFGGGYPNTSVVEAYDENLTRTTLTPLSVARQGLAAAFASGHAIFGGGYSAGRVSVVDAYDTSLTRTTPTSLSTERSSLAAAASGNYVLFGGGIDNDSASAKVDAYDMFLTRSTPEALNTSRYSLAAASIQNYSIFGGGYGKRNPLSSVDVYDPFLTHVIPESLKIARAYLAATAMGDYALFGGGSGDYSTDVVSAVDIYQYV